MRNGCILSVSISFLYPALIVVFTLQISSVEDAETLPHAKTLDMDYLAEIEEERARTIYITVHDI